MSGQCRVQKPSFRTNGKDRYNPETLTSRGVLRVRAVLALHSMNTSSSTHRCSGLSSIPP
uniref:Uncharacterized protein n=1 Tax=Physcomitrium patens TaxID=3218 RepID=A0A2K1IF98_PHYPA|nr:hypothetical protein PHYPA_028543 [Physcomitrium patens]